MTKTFHNDSFSVVFQSLWKILVIVAIIYSNLASSKLPERGDVILNT